jgi:hypothetical protein
MKPGSGWSGGLSAPGRVGSGWGSDANVIARWDMVPFQCVEAKFEVGLPAWHINGMSHVDFSVEGGQWTRVTQMTENPRTGVVEYWAVLDPSLFSRDGPVEVRAICYPKVGIPRVMSGLTLYVNAGGSLKHHVRYVSPNGNDSADGSESRPFRSINRAASAIAAASSQGLADGGIVYLLPGDYVFPAYDSHRRAPTKNTFLTLAGAPGVTRDKVRIVGKQDRIGLNTLLLHVKNLTVRSSDNMPLRTNPDLLATIWIDQCDLIGVGEPSIYMWAGGFNGRFVTDSRIYNSFDAARAFAVVRNVYASGVGADSFSDSGLIINSTVENVVRYNGSHPDIYQMFGRMDNVIMYGLIAETNIESQGFYIIGNNGTKRNVAAVNCRMNNRNAEGRGTAFRVFMIGYSMENVYVKGCKFNGPATIRNDLDGRYIVIEDCTTYGGSAFRPNDGQGIVTFR